MAQFVWKWENLSPIIPSSFVEQDIFTWLCGFAHRDPTFIVLLHITTICQRNGKPNFFLQIETFLKNFFSVPKGLFSICNIVAGLFLLKTLNMNNFDNSHQ